MIILFLEVSHRLFFAKHLRRFRSTKLLPINNSLLVIFVIFGVEVTQVGVVRVTRRVRHLIVIDVRVEPLVTIMTFALFSLSWSFLRLVLIFYLLDNILKSDQVRMLLGVQTHLAQSDVSERITLLILHEAV